MRNKGGKWESSGMGLNIIAQIKHGVCRGEDLGYLVRETYTGTSCRRTGERNRVGIFWRERRKGEKDKRD